MLRFVNRLRVGANCCTSATSFTVFNAVDQHKNCGVFTYWSPIVLLQENDENRQVVRWKGSIDLANNDRVDITQVLLCHLALNVYQNTVLHTSKRDRLGRNFLRVDVSETFFTKLCVTMASSSTGM